MEETLSLYLQRFPLTSLRHLSSHFKTNGSLNRRESGCFFFPPLSLLPQFGFLSRDLMCAQNTFKFNWQIFTQRSQGPGSKDRSLRGIQGQPLCPILDEPPLHLTPHPTPSFSQEKFLKEKGKGSHFPTTRHCSRKPCLYRVCSQEKMP